MPSKSRRAWVGAVVSRGPRATRTKRAPGPVRETHVILTPLIRRLPEPLWRASEVSCLGLMRQSRRLHLSAASQMFYARLHAHPPGSLSLGLHSQDWDDDRHPW